MSGAIVAPATAQGGLRPTQGIHSSDIMVRLKAEAGEFKRPEQRLSTLRRLEEACDDLASGEGAEIIRSAAKDHPELQAIFDAHHRGGTIAIKPPRIAEYVKARRILDQRKGIKSAWTGPTDVTIRGDREGLLAYVRRREIEQENVVKRRKRPAGLEDDIDQIPDMNARQRIRFELDDGREAKRQLRLIKSGLLKIPAIDLAGVLGNSETVSVPSDGKTLAIPSTGPIDPDWHLLLEGLVTRLADKALLASFDLENDGNRIKNKTTKETLIRKPELALLKRLAAGGAS
ncbi:MAG: hypothetical protein RBS99_01015 [Rhodospirillales bacterium]|jgi:hypothetical protein|nr:hypothetical protein [Rhodospirillales bacterium]